MVGKNQFMKFAPLKSRTAPVDSVRNRWDPACGARWISQRVRSYRQIVDVGQWGFVTILVDFVEGLRDVVTEFCNRERRKMAKSDEFGKKENNRAANKKGD